MRPDFDFVIAVLIKLSSKEWCLYLRGVWISVCGNLINIKNHLPARTTIMVSLCI